MSYSTWHAVFIGNPGKGFRHLRRSERWGGDRDVHARHAKGAATHPRSGSEHLASARSEDRKLEAHQLEKTGSEKLIMSTSMRSTVRLGK
jgi:hypothetical protein